MAESESLLPAGLAQGQGATGEGSDLRKPHEMIVMMPKSGRVTLTGRRIYNALLHVSQVHMASMDAMPAADFMFQAPLPTLLRATGSSGEDRTAAKRYLREMRGLEVDWESTAPGDGVKWRGFSMLSEVSIEVRNGENWVSWSYPPTLMAALKDPTRWARIDLEVLAKLGTYASLALYEICARYRDNPSGVTSRKPVAWWADALSNAPAGSERREWRKFKSERVKEAIEEINRETDLEIELIEHKQGRAVVEAQFAVRKKRQAPRAAALPAPLDVALVLTAAQLGIREIKLEGLLLEFGDVLVREGLEALERRAKNKSLARVENAYSYLRSLLRNGGSLTTVDPATREPDGPSRELTRAELAAEVVAATSAATNAEGVWRSEQFARLKAQLAAMDFVDRHQWVEAGIAELIARGMYTPVIRRRVEQGDALHGPLGAVVVRLFAEATIGPDWDKPNLFRQSDTLGEPML